jgi:formamidopyrimidine-DNA glycosylase
MVKIGELSAPSLRQHLAGQEVSTVSRRGKYLLLGFNAGGWLVLHLGMSGRLTVEAAEKEPRPHTHLIVDFDGFQLRLVDPRRFGRIGWTDEEAALDHRLGVEPLERAFSQRYLVGVLKRRQSPIKAILLDQSIVAGLGNIYVDEALFLSRIHPLTLGAEVDPLGARRLVRNVKQVLRQGLANRGTSFSDYVDALGQPGNNQEHLYVYGRKGESCRRCRTHIDTVVIQGRTSHFCPRCQQAVKERSLAD